MRENKEGRKADRKKGDYFFCYACSNYIQIGQALITCKCVVIAQGVAKGQELM